MVEDPQVRVYGEPFRLLGRLAEGEFCDVWWAERVDPVQRVVIKMARDPGPEAVAALQTEAQTLFRLRESTTKGSDYFTQLLPSIRAAARPGGNLEWEDGSLSSANLYGWRSGFVHTYEDIRRAYPQGVDGRTAVWMWKRVLDLLGWLHSTGHAHAGVTPQHILIHARDHGAVLVGWSRCVRLGEPLRARSPDQRIYYPESVWEGEPVTAGTDLLMSARCMFSILGGDLKEGTLPPTVPDFLAQLVLDCARGIPNRVPGSAWDLVGELSRGAAQLYGKSQYHPFTMPQSDHGETTT